MEVKKTEETTLPTPLLIPSNQNQSTELSESKVADVVQLDVSLPVEGQFALLEKHDSNILVKIDTNELALALDQQNKKAPEDKNAEKTKTATITVKLDSSSSSSSSEESTVPLMTQTPDDAVKTAGSVADHSLSRENNSIPLDEPLAEDQQTILDASSTGDLKKLPVVLTDQVKQLLTELNLTADVLQTAGIDLNSLEDLMNRSRYGSIIHFFTSTPLLLSLLRWPWVQRKGLDYSKSNSLKSRHSLMELAAADQFDLEAESAINSPLHINATESDMQDVASGDSQFSVNESSTLLTIHNSDRIFTTHALLLGSQSRLRGVFATNAFYETFETTFEILWSLFASSLVINGIYNFIHFPDVRDNSSVWDALGFTALLNSFCIKSLDFACYPVKGDYEEALALSLSNHYLAASIFGVPLLFSIAHALHALPEATAWDDEQIKSVIQKLKDHQPSFWVDTMVWVFSTVISAAFAPLMPLAMLCELIPDPAIKSVLEKITKSIIWDGRLSHKERLQLFNALLDFSHQSTQLTQIKALSLLAEIAAEISLNDLLHLQKTGTDDDTVKTLIFMKTEAFKQLNYFAKHYQLPNKPHQTIRPLPRFFMANYFLWKLGYPENIAVQPLFYLYKGGKLFFWVLFYKTILSAIFEKVNEHFAEKNCHAEGKFYGWIEPWQRNDCTYCGNLPIYVSNISDPLECIIAYLQFPRNITDVLDLLEQLGDDPKYSSLAELDLSAQKALIGAGNLTKLLNAISHKFKPGSTHLANGFVLQNSALDAHDMNGIISFIKNFTVDVVDFRRTTFRGDAFKLFANIFNTTKLYEVTFSELSSSDVAILGQGLNNSRIAHLSIYDSHLGVAGIKSIVKNLKQGIGTGPILRIYNCTLSETACIALAQELPRFTEHLLMLVLMQTPITSGCVKELALKLIHFSVLQLETDINEDGIISITQSLKNNTNSSMFRSLSLVGHNVSENAIFQLVDAWSSSSERGWFSYFDHRIVSGLNYTALIPKIVNAINKTGTSYFSWGSNPGYGWDDSAVELFVNSIDRDFNYIIMLDLSNNQIGPKGMQALERWLPLDLILRNNNIGSAIASIGEHLSVHQSYSFDFSNNNITAEDIAEFVKPLPISNSFVKIDTLSLANNRIGDKGVTELFKIIKKIKTRKLNLSDTQISTKGAIAIADALVKYNPGLWIDLLEEAKASATHVEVATDLESLDLRGNALGDDGVRELCKKLPYTKIPLNHF